MDAALSLYRFRFQQHPGMFPSTKIAIMDVTFQMLWGHQYKNWKVNSFPPSGTYYYYYGLPPRYAETKMWWEKDVDTLYSCLNLQNSHWVAMVISIPDRTVKIYDSGNPQARDVRLREAAELFSRMVPHAL